MTFCFLRGPLRCEGEVVPILQILIDIIEKPKIQRSFDFEVCLLSETAVIM